MPCTPQHISALAKAICERKLADETRNEPIATALGLLHELTNSYQERYQLPISMDFHYTDEPLNQSNAELIKSCDFYRHHACDHAGWEHSLANKWTRDLNLSLALPYLDTTYIHEHLRPQISRIEGYEQAPWGYEPSPEVSNPTISKNASKGQNRS